ncbi:MAG: AAA family ATPase [SAR202 cluster bacterium]|nr:AAA family ATPase [SAR202 cluster bacterium]
MLCHSCGRENHPEARFCNACGASLVSSDAGPEDSHHTSDDASEATSSQDFVGRRPEMTRLLDAFGQARMGRGQIVMLAGEPGIGKTRVAQELTQTVEDQSARALWGRCHEMEGVLPYWPWLQQIRACIRDTDADDLTAVMGLGVGDIAEIAPELESKIPDLKTPPQLSPERARFRLFDSISTFFMNVGAQIKPLVLVIDDLQWADEPSLQLLEFFSHEVHDANVMVVGTYRDVELSRHHPLSATLGELGRVDWFQRLVLRGLDRIDVGSLLRNSSGGLPSESLVEQVHQQTQGNAFFVTEVARLLGDDGNIQDDAAAQTAIRLPEGVREAIGGRLNRLSVECNSALTVAAVMGSEFTVDALRSALEDALSSQTLNILDEATGAGILDEDRVDVGRFRFNHALIRETLLSELGLGRRVRLHAQIATGLERMYGDYSDQHAAELAHHFLEAEPVMGGEKLIHYSRIAGEQALDDYAYEEGIVHFQKALSAIGERLMDSAQAAILFGLGRSHAGVLHLDEAASCLTKAFDFYADTGDITNAVSTIDFPQSAPLLLRLVTQFPRALEMMPADSLEAAKLLSAYGFALGYGAGTHREARRALDQAQAIAEREGDIILQMSNLASISNVDGAFLHFIEARESGRRAIELSASVEESIPELRARVWATTSAMILGDIREARRHIQSTMEKSEALRDYYWNALMTDTNQAVASLVGDWDEARKLSDRGLDVSPRDVRLLCSRARLEFETGNPEHGDAYIERARDAFRNPETHRAYENSYAALETALSARVSGIGSYTDIALGFADAVLSYQYATPHAILMANAAAAVAAIERGDASQTRELLDSFRDQEGGMLARGNLSPNHLMGLLAHTVGEFDRAVDEFEIALAFCREAGYLPELAWTCYDYATSIAQAPSRRDQVLFLVEEALRISTELGMQPLMTRVTALKAQMEAQPAPPPAYPDGLTAREVEVLSLLAAGRSNREIGEQLFISINTVIRHVSHIFTTTESSNRAEAATYANRHKLV